MFPFVDISENQGTYNMALNTDQLIAIRMSTGALMRFDYQAAHNYANARAAGKKVLQFHYAGNNDPTKEAQLFLAACSPFADGDLYCLDPELAESKEWCNTFDQVVFAATNCHVVDYGNITWANNIGASPDCALWLAAPSWGFIETITELHDGIPYIMQQGPIVNGVDTDMCFITLDTLDKYAYHTPAITAPVVPPVVPPAEPAPITVTDPTPVPATPTSLVEPAQTTVNIPVKVTNTTGTNVDGILPAGTVVKPTANADNNLNDVEKIYDNVGFIQKIVNLFKGRKTYIASALMLLTGVEKYFTGSHTLSQYITTTQGLFGSVGVLGITIRAAIAKLNVY